MRTHTNTLHFLQLPQYICANLFLVLSLKNKLFSLYFTFKLFFVHFIMPKMLCRSANVQRSGQVETEVIFFNYQIYIYVECLFSLRSLFLQLKRKSQDL